MAYYPAVPSLYRANISWQSKDEHEQAKAYARRNKTTVSAIIRKHFKSLLSREKK